MPRTAPLGPVVVDFGGGTGSLISEIERRADEAGLTSRQPIVIDFNFDAVKSASQRGMQAIAASLRCLPLRPCTVDFAIATSVLEHLEHKDDFLNSLKIVSKTGSIVMIQNPNGRFPLDIHYGIPFYSLLPSVLQLTLKAIMDNQRSRKYGLIQGIDTYHLTYIDQAELVRKLEARNFSLICVVPYVYPVDTWPILARKFGRLMLVVRHFPMGHLILAEKA